MNNKYLALPVLAILLLTGCESLRSVPRSLTSTVKLAAYIGTEAALQRHPEWQLAFHIAVAELKLLEDDADVDSARLLSIVNRLPVNELTSPHARIIVTSAVLLLDEHISTVNLTALKDLRPIVKAIREGIELGLVQ